MEKKEPDILTETAKDYLLARTQVEILFSQSAITFLFPVIFAFIISYVIREVANTTILIVWLVVVVLYSIGRYLLLWMYYRSGVGKTAYRKWLFRLNIGIFLSGLVWGVAGIILIPYKVDSLVEFTLYNSLIMLTVCGIVAGAMVSYSISLNTVILYVVPALVPPGLYMITLGDKYNTALGGFVLLYFIFIILTAYRLNSQLLNYAYKDHQYQNIRQHYLRLKKHYDELVKRVQKLQENSGTREK